MSSRMAAWRGTEAYISSVIDVVRVETVEVALIYKNFNNKSIQVET